MKIVSAEFIKSVARLEQLPRDGRPEIAFVGRSNVGKSTLMNTLLNRKKLALTSGTPGKTRLLNFFLINDQFYFVDLPGYGYARTSKQEQQTWQDLIESYLESSEPLRGVVVLLDTRRGLLDMDRQLLQWLAHYKIPVLLVATKADKVTQADRIQTLRHIASESEVYDIDRVTMFSAVRGWGKNEIWKGLMSLLENKNFKKRAP